MLYPGSGKALFVQLKDIILQKIHDGEYIEGSCIPGERQLSEIYGISRVTVRQAINELVQEGILIKKHGKGTYVAFKQINQKLDSLLGFVEEFANKNIKCEVEVQKKEYTVAPEEVCSALQAEKNSRMLMIVRGIFLDGQPLAVDHTFVPEAIAYLIEGLDFRNDILYDFLEKSGYKLTTADQSIGADNPLPEEAYLLKIKTTSPVLVIHRTAFVEGQRPVVYNRTVYRADRYRYTLTLKRYPTNR